MDEQYARNLEQFSSTLSTIVHFDVLIVMIAIVMLAGVAFSAGVMVGTYKERQRYRRHKAFIERVRKDARASNND